MFLDTAYGIIDENMAKRKISFFVFLLLLMLLVLLSVLLQSTDPATVGPWGILGVFILIYLLCLGVLFMVFRFGLYWGKKILMSQSNPKAVVTNQFDEKKAYYVASVLAFVPVTLLSMHAFSQIGWMDIMLVVVFVLIATFFITKRG